MKRRSKSRLRTGNLAMGYCFSLPVMIFLFIFIFLSIAYCFYMSFFEWKLFDLGKDKTFVGLDNYIRIFQDGIFGQAVGNTLIIVFVSQIAITSWTPRGKNLGHGWSRRIYP